MGNSRNELIQVGVALRELRLGQNKTLDDIAAATGLSKSLISKIENFRTIPSLPVLANLCKALKADMADIVQGIGLQPQAAYTVIRKAERKHINREESQGFSYEKIISENIGNALFDSFVVTVESGAKRAAVTTDGMEFIFILKGELEFHIGDEAVKLSKGDALYFDGRLPHVPVNKKSSPAKLLAIYLL